MDMENMHISVMEGSSWPAVRQQYIPVINYADARSALHECFVHSGDDT